MTLRIAFVIVIQMMWATALQAIDCRDTVFNDLRFTVCEINPEQHKLRLFLRDESGDILGNFNTVNRAFGPLLFGMNAGMFHDDGRPVGLYIENGAQDMRLVTNAGPGNFGLLPNGVLCIRESQVNVIETLRFRDTAPDCTYATQSGPMLVIEGALHPRFLKNGTSRHIRNGVGVKSPTEVYFVISDQPVTFYEFGSFFQKYLQTPNALYFDGSVSKLYAPQIGRRDFTWKIGPMIGVLDPE